MNAINDAKKILTHSGYLAQDFELKLIDKSKIPAGSGLYDPVEDLEIKNKKTNKNKTYHVCNGLQGVPSWEIEFENDLKRGFFK